MQQPLSNAHSYAKGLFQSRWHWLILFCAGAVFTFAFPPFSHLPIGFLSLGLLWLSLSFRTQPPPMLRHWFTTGWIFGLGFFGASLHWIYEAFLVDAATFGWMIPFALFGLSAGLAIFTALGCLIAGLISIIIKSLFACLSLRSNGKSDKLCFNENVKRSRPSPALIAISLSIALGASEALRGVILTGFPWNHFGISLSALSLKTVAQSSIFWSTACAVSLFTLPWVMAANWAQRASNAFWGLAIITAIAALPFLLLTFKPEVSTSYANQPPIEIHIVQPAVPQIEKWDPQYMHRNFDILLKLTQNSLSQTEQGGPQLIVWPESSVPFDLLNTPLALARLAAILPKSSILLLGQVRFDEKNRPRNALIALDDNAQIIDIYDKVKLVPFGEFLPFEATLQALGLKQLANGVGGFFAGKGHKTLALPAPFPTIVPFICYEGIFPGFGVSETEYRAQPLAVLVTNDGWFGQSIGPKQHFNTAQLKALELQMPLVRVAYTGTSAGINQDGIPVSTLSTNRRGTLRYKLENGRLAAL